MGVQPLAMDVSATFAGWWTAGAMLAGFVLAVVFWPPIVAWWYHATEVTRLGFERLIYIVGIVALIGGAIWLAAYAT